MANIEEKIEKLIIDKINNLGYELYDVQYVKEAKDYFLRIFIENGENPITLEDCEKVNNEITDMLDKADYIKEQYYLEVSSTGIEKVLRKNKHLEKNLGEKIYIKLFSPIEDSKEFIGILKDFNDDEVIIEKENIIKIIRKNISLIRKYYEW